MDFLKSLGLQLLSTTVIAGTLVWLVKIFLGHILSRDLKKYEREMQDRHDIEIERFRTEMHKVITEHQVRYSRLFEKRFEVIAELHRRLLNATVALEYELSGQLLPDSLPKPDISLEKLSKLDEFISYYSDNSIYIDKSIGDLMDSAIKELMSLNIGLRALLSPCLDASRIPQIMDNMCRARDRLRWLQCPIEESAREMLGTN